MNQPSGYKAIGLRDVDDDEDGRNQVIHPTQR